MNGHFLFLKKKLESSVWYYLGAVLLLFLALIFLIWMAARDPFLKAVRGEPVFYFHASLDSISRRYFIPLLKNFGIALPANVNEFSVVALPDGQGSSTFIISRKKINDSSQKIAKFFWTGIGSQNPYGVPSQQKPASLKKPVVWFAIANYGFVNPQMAATFLPVKGVGLLKNSDPFYFKLNFSGEQINLSLLPGNWELIELVQPRRFVFKKLYSPDLKNFSLKDAQIFWAPDWAVARVILENGLGRSLDSYLELMQNKDWNTLADWLSGAQNFLYFDQSKGEWFASWQSDKPLPLEALESGSRSFLAEITPVLVKRKLADESEFSEIVADPSVFRWTQIDSTSSNIYRLNRVVAGHFMYFGFADNDLWISNNEKMAREALPAHSLSVARTILELKDPGPCKISLNKAKQIFYSVFSPKLSDLPMFSTFLSVDKGYVVDICIHRNVDK